MMRCWCQWLWPSVIPVVTVIYVLLYTSVNFPVLPKPVLPWEARLKPGDVYNTTACPGLRPPLLLDRYTDRWQDITAGGHASVYSAYMDENYVRAIGTARREWTAPVYCQLWQDNTRDRGQGQIHFNISLHVVTGRLEKIPEHFDMRFNAVFYLCPLPRGVVPYAISIVAEEECQRPLHALSIAETSSMRYKFAVCVRAFHERYDDVHQLVQFIELNRLLGAEFFIFYVHSVGPHVQRLLDAYKQEGLLETLVWDVKTGVRSAHDVAGLASRNDCVYKARGAVEHLVMVDVDEFIIPRHAANRTWADLLSSLPEKGAYLFRNSFFHTRLNTNHSYQQTDVANKYQLTTLLCLKRDRYIYEAPIRAKHIVKPIVVDTIGIHYVHKIRDGWLSHVVDPAVGMNHHYRPPEKSEGETSDTTLLKYRGPLLEHVSERWRGLEGIVG